MTHQVLARKWRPHAFSQVVGQTAVLQALAQALAQQRLHHAYLLTGTRGVGKTTLARILAKCMNCEVGVSASPCGVCKTCQEIDAGQFPDFIEVDAASQSKVEETRVLLDNVIYAPIHGRYKIYLIDEVHMLSGHSFNALLKTLEEPPEHVKFLLATTDPERLPATVISRCLHVALTPLSPELIVQQLAYILEQEKRPADKAALQDIAKAAQGSMRDALSLLEPLLTYTDHTLSQQAVRAFLGIPQQESIYHLLHALADRDVSAMLTCLGQLAQSIPDMAAVLVLLIESVQRIALVQLLPDPEADDAVQKLARHWRPEELQLFYQIALDGRRDLPYAATPRSGLEMILLKMLASYSAGSHEKPVIAAPLKPGADIQKENMPVRAPASENTDWARVVQALPITEMTRALAAHCVLLALDETSIKLALAPQYAALLNKTQEQRLQQALEHYWQKPLRLHIVIQASAGQTPAEQKEKQQTEQQQVATQALLADGQVQTMMETFAATLVPGSVRNLESEV